MKDGLEREVERMRQELEQIKAQMRVGDTQPGHKQPADGRILRTVGTSAAIGLIELLFAPVDVAAAYHFYEPPALKVYCDVKDAISEIAKGTTDPGDPPESDPGYYQTHGTPTTTTPPPSPCLNPQKISSAAAPAMPSDGWDDRAPPDNLMG